MKTYKKICVLFLALLAALPSSVYAEMINPDVAELKKDEEIIGKYLFININNNVVYNREDALKDEVKLELIEVADIAYDFYCAYGHEKIVRASVPIYGNYCGPKYGSGIAIDILDEGCKRHDECYKKRGYHKCSCDRELASYIEKNLSKMNAYQKKAAKAIHYWADKKGHNVSEKGGSFSCRL